MIKTLYGNAFCGLSILDNSNGEAFIVNDDLRILKSYSYDDFTFDCKDIVCDYIKLLFKRYKMPILRAMRDSAIKDFLASDYYAQFKEAIL